MDSGHGATRSEPCWKCGCPSEKFDGHVCEDYLTVTLSRVREEYDKAALAVSRIRSDELNDDYWDDDGTLPYYEGKRDALKALLEPQTDA